jgi:hypothetical protein
MSVAAQTFGVSAGGFGHLANMQFDAAAVANLTGHGVPDLVVHHDVCETKEHKVAAATFYAIDIARDVFTKDQIGDYHLTAIRHGKLKGFRHLNIGDPAPYPLDDPASANPSSAAVTDSGTANVSAIVLAVPALILSLFLASAARLAFWVWEAVTFLFPFLLSPLLFLLAAGSIFGLYTVYSSRDSGALRRCDYLFQQVPFRKVYALVAIQRLGVWCGKLEGSGLALRSKIDDLKQTFQNMLSKFEATEKVFRVKVSELEATEEELRVKVSELKSRELASFSRLDGLERTLLDKVSTFEAIEQAFQDKVSKLEAKELVLTGRVDQVEQAIRDKVGQLETVDRALRSKVDEIEQALGDQVSNAIHEILVRKLGEVDRKIDEVERALQEKVCNLDEGSLALTGKVEVIEQALLEKVTDVNETTVALKHQEPATESTTTPAAAASTEEVLSPSIKALQERLDATITVRKNVVSRLRAYNTYYVVANNHLGQALQRIGEDDFEAAIMAYVDATRLSLLDLETRTRATMTPGYPVPQGYPQQAYGQQGYGRGAYGPR